MFLKPHALRAALCRVWSSCRLGRRPVRHLRRIARGNGPRL